MGDVRCDWCGARLPEAAGRERRYCGPAHRQAAWRARRRWREAAPARKGVAAVGEVLLLQVSRVVRLPVVPPPPGSPVGWNCAAVAQVSDLAGQLVRAAVLADRQAGASWAQIGAGLGISAEAARSRFGRSRSAAPVGRGG
ncbi:hypothetical protein [Streptomyces sp. NBC_00154]|uniref:hypothetical protein n=1 Tax=Streptomyces sp. NBC_00154 TaxID=2975670 RepID=UPI002251316D|nr:hypothetical protein [Streptomyces sp. NBC_00154]MCX5315873.1 hypothetical protein [Streptomyces sp. NBC_00154]